ncbi:MAG: Gfo/Idh/MocA family oxidoreductase [Clostridia bacterium]|nr:Gfo/Idh/MocA family oxidoreductase [Clostridia bacterium]
MPIRIGMIGGGSITRLRHAPECRDNPYCEIAGFYDHNIERSETLVEEFGGKSYSSCNEMLADPDIDAVCICSSNDTHARIAIDALSAGKHVLCEKPMAANVKEAAAMVKAAESNQRTLMIAHNQRFVPAHIKAREMIASGSLGRVISFRASLKHGGPENWSVVKSNKTWFFNESRAVFGVMGDLGIHKADLLRYLLNDEVDSVLCLADTVEKRNESGNLIGLDDIAFATLKMSGGAVGTLEVSWCNHGQMEDFVVVYCENGVIRLLQDPVYQIVIEQRDGEVLRLSMPEPQNGSGIMDAFAASVLSGTEPSVSGKDALLSLAVITACLESSKKESWVKVNP